MAARAAAASAAAAAAALGSALAFAAAALISAADWGGGLGGASNTCHCTCLRSYPDTTLTLLESVGPQWVWPDKTVILSTQITRHRNTVLREQ